MFYKYINIERYPNREWWCGSSSLVGRWCKGNLVRSWEGWSWCGWNLLVFHVPSSVSVPIIHFPTCIIWRIVSSCNAVYTGECNKWVLFPSMNNYVLWSVNLLYKICSPLMLWGCCTICTIIILECLCSKNVRQY